MRISAAPRVASLEMAVRARRLVERHRVFWTPRVAVRRQSPVVAIHPRDSNSPTTAVPESVRAIATALRPHTWRRVTLRTGESCL